MGTDFFKLRGDIVCDRLNLRLDKVLLLASGIIILIGFIMVTSASLHLGEGHKNGVIHYPYNQFFHILIGLLAAIVVSVIRLTVWEKMGQWLFLLGLALLVAVFIPGLGVKVNGSTRWLDIGVTLVQVSEVVKLISVIYMAGYIARHVDTVRGSIYGMVRPLALLAFACVLLLLEPDFGAAVVILMIALSMMFLGGARLWQFATLVISLTVIGGMLIYFSGYRSVRVLSFLDPWSVSQGAGFQLIQALIAFGRGEWTGVGLGGGLQKLFYLPEGHTDFLFAVIGEELGLIGVCVVIVLFTVVIWKAFEIGKRAETAGLRFPAFLAYGLGLWFGLQAFINMGVNMGMLPTKGLTLPLMSYGGGSMIIMCCGMAMLHRVHSETVAQGALVLKRDCEWLSES